MAVGDVAGASRSGHGAPDAGSPDSGSTDAVRRFDLAMQRAVAVGLAVALVQGVAIAVLGRELYPSWWWLTGGPIAAAITATAIAAAVTGRFDRRSQVAFAVGVSVSAVLAGIATGDAVAPVVTAILPIVVISLLGIGFLAPPPAAAALGGLIILADTVLPAFLRPDTMADSLTQTAIQSLILISTATGGSAARRVAVTEERALDELARAVGADRAAAAARAQRRELERELHDTVLNTLSALGRGSLPDSAAVRQRCAADARFLSTRHVDDDPTPCSLTARLQAAVAEVRESGFDVELAQAADDDLALPREVVTALVRATREALTNAHRHSGAPYARVEVQRRGPAVTVRVVDRGRGTASSDAAAHRLGVRRSIVERMDDVGGHAEIGSTAGVGTTVVLRWPR